ncbi:MAG: tRNA threonylcarbamoyladenosine dehydratase [Bacteroidales bacterium]|nr:tRNA threonylcarbamoyladenosine dehydratase [Bacteroidales bacterium]
MSLDNWTERTELLIGSQGVECLKNSHVLIAGLGGVGGFTAEILARAGVGIMTLIDADNFHISNLNRQLGALTSTIGRPKTEVLMNRLKDINPEIKLNLITEFIVDERITEILNIQFDYIADAIDSLAPKTYLILNSLKRGYKLISSMGAGGKMHPEQIRISDFSKSFNDGLARMLRKRLHKQGIYTGFPVVFSPEKTNPHSIIHVENERNKKTTAGTISYMPMMFGAYMASYIIRDLLKNSGVSVEE